MFSLQFGILVFFVLLFSRFNAVIIISRNIRAEYKTVTIAGFPPVWEIIKKIPSSLGKHIAIHAEIYLARINIILV
jgi:hypothetical protein